MEIARVWKSQRRTLGLFCLLPSVCVLSFWKYRSFSWPNNLNHMSCVDSRFSILYCGILEVRVKVITLVSVRMSFRNIKARKPLHLLETLITGSATLMNTIERCCCIDCALYIVQKFHDLLKDQKASLKVVSFHTWLEKLNLPVKKGVKGQGMDISQVAWWF